MSKKLTLKIEELAVESFLTDQHAVQNGTIHAHETMINDTCGDCGSGHSCGGLSGCAGCFPTNGCTWNPAVAECYDSYHFCYVTHVQCCDSETGNSDCQGASGLEFC
jgi:hypothetical protein